MKGGKKRNPTSLDSAIPSENSISDPSVSTGAEDGLRNSMEEAKLVLPEDVEREVEGEEDGDFEGDEDVDQQEIDAEEGEREKLAEGYYEIEAVRRKRVRKGQVQYLIKWRGWSEAENTWEPLDNLLQVYDIIEAFEESLKAGKNRSTRKRKRKNSVTTTPVPTKKRQQRHHQQQSLAAASYDPPSHVIRISEEPNSGPGPRQNSSNKGTKVYISPFNGDEEEAYKDEKENGTKRDLHSKLGEKSMLVSHEDNSHRSSLSVSPQDMIPAGANHKSDGGDSNQHYRCFGAKKRKCGSVKRFKRDPVYCSADDAAANVGETCTSLIPIDFQHQDSMETKHEDLRNLCSIIEIIKPISYKVSMTSNVQEVLVAFDALRSDGTKVTVDNKFLKANNPLLLIDFYEKNLRYCPT